MKQICSYCQRDYGTISINNKPIYPTLDHIEPISRSGRRGIRMVGVNSFKELDNLVECCNECNVLKNNNSLSTFKYKLKTKKFVSIKPASYLNPKIINNIIKAINILSDNKCNSVNMRITYFDTII